MDKKKIKERIEILEYRNNNIRHINGACVRVVNLEIKKRENKVIADVILDYQIDRRTERYNDCEYKLDDLMKIKV